MTRLSASRSARVALDWLGQDPGLARLAEAAQRLMVLQQEVDRVLAPLRVRVLSLDQGRLLVGADHASVAARLRQREPSLVRHLVARGWPVNAVSFRPPRARDQAPMLPSRIKDVPQAGAVAALGQLAERVRHPELARALQRFAQRHSRTD
ncbi:MAG: DciA family protein [Burkholderiales bacterium]|jgi:hypothetical protein